MSSFSSSIPAVTGIDEAGRGAIAGPLVVASVTWPDSVIDKILVKDSKLLSPNQRDKLFSLIVEHALSFSYVSISPEVIDAINIRQATLKGMSLAYRNLSIVAPKLIIDGIDAPLDLPFAQTLPKADQLIPAVSAASIVAKVVRDRLMAIYHEIYPDYGILSHKGYGTALHQRAIEELGYSAIHRKTFQFKKKIDPVCTSL